MFEAARDRPQLLADIMAMKNWEVRQAAINFGIDMGQMHVGSRQGLGPEQIGRQALLDELIRRGAKPEEIPGLARPPEGMRLFTKPMRFPTGRGGSVKIVLGHEVGHTIVSGLNGQEQEGIISQFHRDMIGRAGRAAQMGLAADLRDAQGNFDPVKVAQHLDKELENLAAGVAANELLDGIPRHRNPGRHGDVRAATEFMDAVNMPLRERPAAWNAAVDRALEKLRPLVDMMREEISWREDNLGKDFHFSKQRAMNLVERAKRETLEAAGQQGLFERPGQGAPGGPGASQGIAGGQGISTPVAAAPPQAAVPKLKPFRAPKIDFIVAVDDGSGMPRFDRFQATDRVDLDRQTRARYPTFRQGVVLHEIRPKSGPIFRPWEEGESPLHDMPSVSDEEVEGRARREDRRAARAAATGRPILGAPETPAVNGGAVSGTRAADQKPGYFGPQTVDQRVDKWTARMTPEEITEWRNWYPEVASRFATWFGNNLRKLGAWVMSQKNTSPSGGMTNVQRTEDIMQGFPRVLLERPVETGGTEWKPLSGGMAEDQIREMLQGETPEKGAAAKIHDFMDSLLGRLTRTWMGDNPRFGQPSAVDIHGARGAGFVDQKLVNAVREQYGDEVANQLVVDFKGSLSEAQYAHAVRTFNEVAAELNRRNYMGGGWTASQVQAVDWAATGKQIGREMELPAAIFDQNTRRIAYEVNPNGNSPLGKLAPWDALAPDQAALVTHDTAEHAIKLAMKEAGGQVAHKVYGPGGWMDFFSPSARVDVLSSPEAAERTALVLGHLLGQEEVLIVRPRIKGGNGHVFEVTEVGTTKLSEPNVVQKYWEEFRKLYPDAEGFMPVRNPNGTVGISIARKAGHFNPAELQAMAEAADKAAGAVGIKNIGWDDSPAEVLSLRNDWEHYPNGEQYLRRLAEIGKPGILQRMEGYRRAIQKTYLDSYRKAISRTREAGP